MVLAAHELSQALASYRSDPHLAVRRAFFLRVPRPLPQPPGLPQHVFVTVDGLPLLAQGADTPLPTASTGKIMTAYVVLHDPGLPLGRPITITQADVISENQGYLAGDSEVPLTRGEHFTVRQLLYALMLPSADDAAQVLARASSFGSQGFLAAMNRDARLLGLRHSHFTDPSGALATNVSSARDLVLLTEEALQDPFFARLVSTRYAVLPRIGLIGNLNWMLWNVPGAIGVKTGWTSAAGHALVFAARRVIEGQKVTVVGAILGMNRDQGTFQPVFHEGRSLVDYAFRDLYRVSLPSGPVGVLQWPNGVRTTVSSPVHASVLVPRGTRLSLTWQLHPAPTNQGTLVGTYTVRDGSLTLATLPLVSSRLPSWFLRLYALGRLLAHL